MHLVLGSYVTGGSKRWVQMCPELDILEKCSFPRKNLVHEKCLSCVFFSRYMSASSLKLAFLVLACYLKPAVVLLLYYYSSLRRFMFVEMAVANHSV